MALPHCDILWKCLYTLKRTIQAHMPSGLIGFCRRVDINASYIHVFENSADMITKS